MHEKVWHQIFEQTANALPGVIFFLFVFLYIAILSTFLQTADISETLFTSLFKFRYLL